jgi:hypothetical protein
VRRSRLIYGESDSRFNVLLASYRRDRKEAEAKEKEAKGLLSSSRDKDEDLEDDKDLD